MKLSFTMPILPLLWFWRLSTRAWSLSRRSIEFGAVTCLAAFLLGCNTQSSTPTGQSSTTTAGSNSAQPSKHLTLATTTSTQDTGLLDVLLPKFRAASGIEVKVVAVGSGQAMELGRRGDADLLLVHSPEAEEQFVADGYGSWRYPLMFNEFVIVGPPEDPAGIKGQDSAVEALRKLAAASATFVSRGDKSGTHVKEQALWKRTGIEPQGDWYLKAGSGMAETLRIAEEKSAYTLTDRATYLTQRSKLSLAILAEGDVLLRNPYAVVQMNPAKFPHLNHSAAQEFIDYVFRREAQQLIAEFGRDTFGQPLFFLVKKERSGGR